MFKNAAWTYHCGMSHTPNPSRIESRRTGADRWRCCGWCWRKTARSQSGGPDSLEQRRYGSYLSDDQQSDQTGLKSWEGTDWQDAFNLTHKWNNSCTMNHKETVLPPIIWSESPIIATLSVRVKSYQTLNQFFLSINFRTMFSKFCNWQTLSS